MYIKNWLEYQNILDKIDLENIKYKTKFQELPEKDIEQSLDVLQLQTESVY